MRPIEMSPTSADVPGLRGKATGCKRGILPSTTPLVFGRPASSTGLRQAPPIEDDVAPLGGRDEPADVDRELQF